MMKPCGLATVSLNNFRMISALFAATILLASMQAQTPSMQAEVATNAAASHRAVSQYQPSRFPKRAGLFYQEVWGIDSLIVRATESGELIRFSYRVIDATRAMQLNDKSSRPTLVDAGAGVELVIPSLEKVGQLRQSSTPEEGKTYWMAFSNTGRRVKKGDRVDVRIGGFQAHGLLVD